MKATLEFLGGMKFRAVPDSGHEIIMDSSPAVGGADSAARPMEHFLVSIAGCTGMDVVSILRKMKVDFDSFNIEIEAERADSHPKVFKKVRITYIFSGRNIDERKVQKAIDLSQEKYCSASAMVRASAEVEYSYRINA